MDYSAERLAKEIKSQCRNKGIQLKDMLSCCGININAVSKLNSGSWLSAEKLARMADYLDVSLDQLMGRKRYLKKGAIYKADHNSIAGEQNVMKVSNAASGIEAEMLEMFQHLKFRSKVEIMRLIAEKENEENGEA